MRCQNFGILVRPSVNTFSSYEILMGAIQYQDISHLMIKIQFCDINLMGSNPATILKFTFIKVQRLKQLSSRVK